MASYCMACSASCTWDSLFLSMCASSTTTKRHLIFWMCSQSWMSTAGEVSSAWNLCTPASEASAPLGPGNSHSYLRSEARARAPLLGSW